jgi:hypothetical protein
MASAASQETAETSNNEQSESRAPQRKEYHAIETSLVNPALQPGAPWGFVVFRTVYGSASNERWARMLDHLRSNVAQGLALENQTELLPRHELTVVEDEATLSGADPHAVRRAFCTWVAEDLPPRLCDADRLGGIEEIRAKLISNSLQGVAHNLPPRWNFCIFVDDECLRSVDKRLPAVKILVRDWEGVDSEEEEEEQDPDEYEEQEDAGWMYMDGTMLPDYVGTYSLLTDMSAWDDFYQRPLKGYLDQ